MRDEKLSMRIVNPKCAGIDVGSRMHMVAVDQFVEHVRKFGVYTTDHEALISYLNEHGITTIAMESTGSYWQTLFDALQKAGFEVLLVNGAHIKNVKGKKTDVLDCLWIQKLHSLGLLQGSFLLNDYLQTLRTYYMHRQYLIRQASKYINKIQKALRLMNIRLDVVINDITGKSGRAILDAIIGGERNPTKLASLTSNLVKKSKEEIALALQGHWRDDLLFEVSSCLSFYDTYEQAISVCDKKMEVVLAEHKPADTDVVNDATMKSIPKKKSKYSPSFNVRHLAFAHLRTDLFEIPGISHNTVLCILSNLGNDIKKFKTAKQFASWLRLVPNNKVSGGRIISSRTPKGKNVVATALRQAANSIGNQKDHPLTPFFRRIAYRKGRIAAITATARKLAIITWNMINKAEAYKECNYEEINEKRKASQLNAIEKRLSKMNLAETDVKHLFQKLSLSTS
jgi:transposase